MPTKLNWGNLEEIPEISINRFGSLESTKVDRKTARAFFLTHFDDEEILDDVLNMDFLNFLDDESNCESVRLYLHYHTYNFLHFWAALSPRKYNNVPVTLDMLRKSGRIVLIRKNIPFRVCFPGAKSGDVVVEVVALSAGSNLGSIMLLFEALSETKFQRILYTGKCRVALKDLKYCQPLHDRNGHVKTFTRLYIDTTHCEEHIEELPGRRKLIEESLDLLQQRIAHDPLLRLEISTKFIATDLHYLRVLHEKVKEQVHITPQLYALLKTIPAICPSVTSVSGRDCIFHFHYTCNVLEDKDERCATRSSMGVHFSVESVHLNNSPNDLKIHSNGCSRGGAIAYSGTYASSLSRMELGRFLNYIQIAPNLVKPLYLPKNMDIEELKFLLHLTCVTVDEEPEEIADDYPSTFHDLTGSTNIFNSKFYDMERINYMHKDKNTSFTTNIKNENLITITKDYF